MPVTAVDKVWKPKLREVGICSEVESVPDINEETKQGDGMKVKEFKLNEHVDTPKSGSSNRFAILDTVLEKEDEWEEESSNENDLMLVKEKKILEPKKLRAESVGIAELMKTLKPKKKRPVDKDKAKWNKASSNALGSHASSSSQ